jgi:hypothetical protein
MTNRPDWWTHMRPHVFIVTGNADGTVLMDWISLRVERPLKSSNGRPSFSAREISPSRSLSTENTAIVELSSLTTYATLNLGWKSMYLGPSGMPVLIPLGRTLNSRPSAPFLLS